MAKVAKEKLDNNITFLRLLVKAQARLLVCYRTHGQQPPEWVFDTIERAKKAGIEC